MKPSELAAFLDSVVRHQLKLSTMIWGPPGIGKSSIVAQTARAHGLAFIDLRLSQLAPTDLRGLPVARGGTARWAVPEFLPREGAGVLFLDEINLAPPTMQGMAQQLILDRRVGSYALPEGWFIWAAGNRSEDRAAVFDMPAPLANRFIHLDVAPDLASFTEYAIGCGLHEQIVAFLAFRPELLHKIDAREPAWPSPRSWEMASALHAIGASVAPAVGLAAAAEFAAFVALYGELPDLGRVLGGEADELPFPQEPSLRYATVIGLSARVADAQGAFQALRWVARKAPLEFVDMLAEPLLRKVKQLGERAQFQRLVDGDADLQRWLGEYQKIIAL
jgi:MoxR-like ATPase